MSSYYDTNLIKKYTSNYTLYHIIVVPKIDMHVICVDNSSKGGGGHKQVSISQRLTFV